MIKILRWFFGLGWLIGGITVMADISVIGGILISLAGLLVLPPTFNFIAQATGKVLGKPIKYISVILLLAAGVAIVSPKQAQKAAEEKQLAEAKATEKKKQEQLAYERLSPAAKDSMKRAAALEEKNKKAQDERAAEYAAKKGRREKIEAQFSAYDGSHPGVEKAIKRRMNDPDSYEHVSTRFIDKGSYIAVLTQFRGKNAFNGKVLSTATAKVDMDGNLLELQVL